MKRHSLLLLCALLCLTLAACKKPVGGTPYESTDPYDPPIIIDGDLTSSLEDDSSLVLGDDNDDNTSGSTTANTTTKGTAGRGTTTTGGNSNEVELDWGDVEPTVVTDSKGSTVTDKNGDAVTVTTTTTATTASTTKPTQQEEVKGISLPKEGYMPDTNLKLGKVTIDKNYKVTMVIKNITTKWESDQTSYFEYTCYDKDGKALRTDKLPFGRIHAGKSVTCQFTVPTATEKVELTKYVAEFWSDGWK